MSNPHDERPGNDSTPGSDDSQSSGQQPSGSHQYGQRPGDDQGYGQPSASDPYGQGQQQGGYDQSNYGQGNYGQGGYGQDQQSAYGQGGGYEQSYGQPSASQPYEQQQPYGQPTPYGFGGAAPYGQVPREHPKGTQVLILGILSIVVCPILGPFAMVQGKNALAEIDANPAAYSNRGTVNVGRILGIIGTVLIAFWVIYLVVMIIIGVTTANSGY